MPSNLQPILFLVAIAAVFYLLMIRPQQKKRKETQNMLRSLTPGSEIITQAGLYGKIVAIEADDTLLVEVAPGVTCKYLKQAVMRVVPEVAAGDTKQESLPESSSDDEKKDEDTADAGATAETGDEPKSEAKDDAATDGTSDKADKSDSSDESGTPDADRRSS